MAKTQGRHTEATYRRVLAEHEQGTSLTTLASRLGVKRSTLKWWKSELKRRDRKQTFLPVKVVDPPARTNSPSLFEIAHPTGSLIRVPPGFAGEDLTRLVRALEHARC